MRAARHCSSCGSSRPQRPTAAAGLRTRVTAAETAVRARPRAKRFGLRAATARSARRVPHEAARRRSARLRPTRAPCAGATRAERRRPEFLAEPPHLPGPHQSRSPGTSSGPRHPCRRRRARRSAGRGSAAPSARIRRTRGPASPPSPWRLREAATEGGKARPRPGYRTAAPRCFPTASAAAVARSEFEPLRPAGRAGPGSCRARGWSRLPAGA